MATVNEDQQQEYNEQAQSVTQLEFHQAMRDFKTMFPEMDEDVIEVVLRANSGAVDATIDQLLSMSTDNENERLRTELDATENAEVPPCYSPATPPPSYQQAVPYAQSPAHSPAVALGNSSPSALSSSPTVPRRHQQAQLRCQLSRSFPQSHMSQTLPLPKRTSEKVGLRPEKPSIPLRSKRNWRPPLLGPLPPTFLRLEEFEQNYSKPKAEVKNVTVLSSSVLQQRMEENERQRQISHSVEDPGLSQYLEDERIAIFLQNEEFMQELRHNKEFMSTLERDLLYVIFDEDSLQQFFEDSCSGYASPDTSDDDYDNKLDQPPEDVDSFPHLRHIHPIAEDTDAAFREKLRNMGKLSRRKFTQLAKLFSRRKRSGFRQILGDGSNPSRDNLLLTEDDYFELSEEESESDLRKDDTWNSHAGGHGKRMGTVEHGKHEINEN